MFDVWFCQLMTYGYWSTRGTDKFMSFLAFSKTAIRVSCEIWFSETFIFPEMYYLCTSTVEICIACRMVRPSRPVGDVVCLWYHGTTISAIQCRFHYDSRQSSCLLSAAKAQMFD